MQLLVVYFSPEIRDGSLELVTVRQPARRDLKHATGKRKDGKGSLTWIGCSIVVNISMEIALKCYNNHGEKGIWRLHRAGIRHGQ
jgi:hypothetical protein